MRSLLTVASLLAVALATRPHARAPSPAPCQPGNGIYGCPASDLAGEALTGVQGYSDTGSTTDTYLCEYAYEATDCFYHTADGSPSCDHTTCDDPSDQNPAACPSVSTECNPPPVACSVTYTCPPSVGGYGTYSVGTYAGYFQCFYGGPGGSPYITTCQYDYAGMLTSANGAICPYAAYCSAPSSRRRGMRAQY